MKTKNWAAQALTSRLFAAKTVKPKKGKGSFKRNQKHRSRDA